MEQKQKEQPANRHDLRHMRMQLHGHRRHLHDQITEICENFLLEDLNTTFKRNTLVRELEYLLGYYKDNENWQGIE